MIFLASLLIGIVAGLRTMTAPAGVAWAAWLGWIDLAGTWAGFLRLALGGARLLDRRARRVRHRPAADHAAPQGAAAVRRPRSSRAASAARRSALPAAAGPSGWSPASSAR